MAPAHSRRYLDALEMEPGGEPRVYKLAPNHTSQTEGNAFQRSQMKCRPPRGGRHGDGDNQPLQTEVDAYYRSRKNPTLLRSLIPAMTATLFRRIKGESSPLRTTP